MFNLTPEQYAILRRQILEEAAKLCDDNANEWHGQDGKYACEDSANRIRALADEGVA